MNILKRSIFVLVLASLLPAAPALAGEPGWTTRVIMTPVEREHYKKIPIKYRPYRPLHVYGNTIRRRHYRGQRTPQVKDVTTQSRILLRQW